MYLGKTGASEATRKINLAKGLGFWGFFQLNRCNLYESSKNNELGNKLTKNSRKIS